MTTTPQTIPDQTGLCRLLADLRGLVLLHHSLGVDGYPIPARPKPLPGPHDETVANHGVCPVSATPATTPSPRLAPTKPTSGKPEEALAALRERLEDCRGCNLHQQRKRIVFGQGGPRARLLIIGQAPGPAEEAAGLPFQGESGALLDRMLAAIKLSRDSVYLTTLVKCAPPGSRPPAPDEARGCLPHLLAQIAALKPALICVMGQEPARILLGSKLNLLQLRGRFHDYRGIPLMPTLAPDFLLINPEMKKAAWQDLQMIQKRLRLN